MGDGTECGWLGTYVLMSQPYARPRSESDVPAAVTPASPTSTYRLQLCPEFPFSAAEAAVPHLASLGVSHLHLSPVLEAVPGSTHGYDVTDHTRVRVELGGEPGLRALATTARGHGLGLVLDIVPNHMAVPRPLHLNRPLWEVLREGPHSPYARWFDIDWEANGGQVLLPVLAGPPAPASSPPTGSCCATASTSSRCGRGRPVCRCRSCWPRSGTGRRGGGRPGRGSTTAASSPFRS
ncbi:hypothetical protein GCM10020254_23190 [Streptomyces goshikiensis]